MATDPNNNHDIMTTASDYAASSNNNTAVVSSAIDNTTSDVGANEMRTSGATIENNNLSLAMPPNQPGQSSLPVIDAPHYHDNNNLKAQHGAAPTEEFDMEVWANSLVGRWWEIFWEPAEEEKEDNAPEADGGGGVNSTGGFQISHDADDVVMSIRGGGVKEEYDDDTDEDVPIKEETNQSANNTAAASTNAAVGQQQQQTTQQQSSIPTHHRERPRSSKSQKKASKQQSKRPPKQSQPYQHRPRFLDYDATKRQSPQSQREAVPPQPIVRPQQQPNTRPQPSPITTTTASNTRPQTTLFNVVYHGPKLGLSLAHQQQQQGGLKIIIKEVSPNAPNANLIQSGDYIVGMNGKRFTNTTGSSNEQGEGNDNPATNYFNRVVAMLRDTPRPMTVTFERRLLPSNTNAETPNNNAPMVASKAVGGSIQSNNQLSAQAVVQPVANQQVIAPSIPNPLIMNQTQVSAGTLHPDTNHIPKAKATERELQYPLEPATDFPPGWKKRVIPRMNGMKVSTGRKSIDTYYYSPVHEYKFRSKPEVRLFLEMLARAMGDETIAIEEFRREKSKKRGRGEKKSISSMTAAEGIDIKAEEDVPLVRLQKEMGENKRRQNSSDEDQSESDATSTSDDDDDDSGEDAIDWYDGKILSFADGNFVVYFLGDAEDVTYTMPLTPKIVRPSVRAWTKRTLALLSCDVDLTNEDAFPTEIVDSLPPSTAIPQDKDNSASDGKNESNTTRLKKYSKLLETQIHLGKQLSPHADEDQSGGTVDGKDEGPGPFANKSYVRHLRTCLEESKRVCDWLSKEVDALNVFKRVSDAAHSNHQDSFLTAHVPKDSIQSFLVNGATFLQRILALIPSKIDAVSMEQNSRHRKKRRLTATKGLSEQTTLPTVSSDSLDDALKRIFNECGTQQGTMLITSTLNQIVSVLYLDLWQPYQDWIRNAEDMIYGKTAKFYSFEDIESHIKASHELTLFDVLPWRIDLETKLNRARFFEMEAWSAIKACTALDETENSTASDSCLLSLNRLQNELSVSTLKAGEQSIMRNMNPLGKRSVSADGTHSLTRDDIENAIKTRQWILDLMHAKTARERASFVQSVIERYVTLPQLPSPPYSDFDESVSDATTLLKENTKDFISALSANCYSHTHIVGNMAAKLSSSMQITAQDTSLRTKEGVALALAELRKLPIFSVVEEKLQAREQLIKWNAKALQLIESTTTTGKKQFQVLENMHNELSNILKLTNCQNLRPNETIEREIKCFVAEDVKLVCPESGVWVQNQYKRGCDWKQNYLSIKSLLGPYGYDFGEISSSATAGSASSIDASRIRNLLVEHDTLASCFIEECRHLRMVKNVVNDWTAELGQVLANDSYHLEERYNELVKVEASRPKGIIANPSPQVVALWVRVLAWGLKLKKGVDSVTEKLLEWKANQLPELQTRDAEFQESVRLTKLLLASIIVEGQDFMLSNELLTPLLSQHWRKAMATFSNERSEDLISKRQVIESSSHGKLLLSRVTGMAADVKSGFPLRFVRDIFWKLMAYSLMQTVNDRGSVDLNDVKTFSTLCVCDSEVSLSLKKLIDNAEQLQRNATSALTACSKLLQIDCFLHHNELRQCLVDLHSIQADFKDQGLASAARLLQSNGVETAITTKLSSVAWLVDTFSHSVLFDSANGSLQSHRVSVNELQLLYEKSPVHTPSRVGRNDVDIEVLRVHNLVTDLHYRAQEWRKTARSLLQLDAGPIVADAIKVETIDVLTQSEILHKVTFPELSAVKSASSVALELKDRLSRELFCIEYQGIDVNKGRLPGKSSLIAASGDFLLYRFTGGEMYSAIERALNSLKELSSQLLVMTVDKTTVEWLVKVFDWVTLLRDAFTDQAAVAGPTNMRLVLKIDRALSIVEQGHAVFYHVSDEIQQQLLSHKVATKILPGKVSFEMMKQSTFTLGLSLLRWTALLFECLKVDLDRQDHWKESVLNVTETYQMFQANGLITTFGGVTNFNNKVKKLVSEASNLVIQDDHLIRFLFQLSNIISTSDVFKKQLEIERIASEEKLFMSEKNRFEASLNIANSRNDHLRSLLTRLSSAHEDGASRDDEDSLFIANDPSVRDKSRLFLEKSLFKGMETLGMELNIRTRDFVSNLAWELELAIFLKYCSNETLSSEYREKVRSLRFNLQDPKNPMLCTRVISGQLKIADLIEMSTDALASKQLKQIRQQVVQDAIKNVVISHGTSKTTTGTSTGITSELAKRIRIESVKKSNSSKEKAGSPLQTSTATICAISPAPTSTSLSPMQVDPPTAGTFTNATVSELLAAIPPPPMQGREHPLQLKPPTMDVAVSPPSMMEPPPLQDSSSFENSHSHGHHISSQDGFEEFSFTISRLKLSFISKIFVDQSCEFQLDGFLPHSLTEKGRLEVDEFNKFVNEKSRSGKKWKVVVMKLSSMSGDENTSSYKRFYKEYESVRRICMFQVSDTTKVFLVTPKFLRICKCVNSVKNLSRTSTYVVVITKEPLPYCQNN